MTEEEKEKDITTDTIEDDSILKIRDYVRRLESLEEEKTAIAEHIKDIYNEAKSNGFNTKHIKKIISLKKVPEEKRMADEEELEIYKLAIGIK